MRTGFRLTLFVVMLISVMAVAACGPTVVSDPPEMDTSGQSEGEESQGMPLPPDSDFPAGPHAAVTGEAANSACEGSPSIGGGPSVALSVSNTTDVTFTAYWVDFEGVDQALQDIAPGETFASETGVLQNWCFREKDTGNYAQGLIMGSDPLDYTLTAASLTQIVANLDCADLVSVPGGAEITMIVNNPTDTTFVVYWIDFDGNAQQFDEVGPGMESVVTTGVEQSWCFSEKDTGAYEHGATVTEASRVDLTTD